MSHAPDPLQHRRPDYEIEPHFPRLWSPRALSGAAVSQADLLRLFEAARWAPSFRNFQEWHFLYAHKDTLHWPAFFDLLMEANQVWCQRAGALVLVTSRKFADPQGTSTPIPTHSFDAGLATQNLLLQAASMGLAAHPMAGFNASKARVELRVPDSYQVEIMIAVGHPGNPADLPDGVREREVPNGRKPVAEIAMEGPFNV